jgi:DNA processing protein
LSCEGCLRRSALLGLLAPYIARSLDEHRKLPALLALEEEELVKAVCGAKADRVRRRLDRFDAPLARQRAARAELAALCRHDGNFPSALLEAPDAPAMLYVRGDTGALQRLQHERPVAIVGSRRASSYGLEAARALARDLAACGVPIVSGMALGIDSAAHEGALTSGGLTVAVLAGGADVPYPRSKGALYRRIAAEGVVVSELPPQSKPFRWSFPARNRIMAGLSAMTVVVEGKEDSGSLITAGFAMDLGREVGAVPGQITSPLASGPNALLADGACVVRSPSDVLDAVHGIDHGRSALGSAKMEGLDRDLQEVLVAVECGQGTADAIASGPGQIPAVLAALTELEMKGLVRRAAGGRYLRRA